MPRSITAFVPMGVASIIPWTLLTIGKTTLPGMVPARCMSAIGSLLFPISIESVTAWWGVASLRWIHRLLWG